MRCARLSPNGKLVIPSRLRRALGWRAGGLVSLRLDGERLVIEPVRTGRARLVEEKGRKVLVAAPSAPPMAPEHVKAILDAFP